MEKFLKKYFLENLHRKLFVLLVAVVIWLTVNNSITSTRVFTRVPVRVVNVPPDKTIRGLMANGTLDRKLTLTVTGSRSVIDKMDSSDFEAVIDAADKGDEWVVQISKKNLVSLYPDIDLLHNITNVLHNEFVIRLCPLITARIPVWVTMPKGEPPEGYQFLDVWPQKLSHFVSGPEDDVKKLMQEGLELNLDLSFITKEELDVLRSDEFGDTDEVSYFVPDSWKKVSIPFLNAAPQMVNGTEAKHLRIEFLREEMMPVKEKIPIRLFYPPTLLQEFNPQSFRLVSSECVIVEKGLAFLNTPLYVKGVSQLFLNLVRDHMEILLIPVKRNNKLSFRWDIQFVDASHLEDAYLTLTLGGGQEKPDQSSTTLQTWKQHVFQRERSLGVRFQEYMENFQFYMTKDKPLLLDVKADREGNVSIHLPQEKP